tara:strand:+ start:521 stop:811 length:291 start_codon:yes stop_codon:yes gene_type:complete
MNQTREMMVESLHKGICKVTFEKVDGTNRIMNCTLKPNILAKESGGGFIAEEMKLTEAAKNTNVIPVWDMDAQGWRSFRIDSVENFETSSVLMEEL